MLIHMNLQLKMKGVENEEVNKVADAKVRYVKLR